jgi:hypothetical protein
MNKGIPSKESRLPAINSTKVPVKKQHKLNLCNECKKLYIIIELENLTGRNYVMQEVLPAHIFKRPSVYS